MILALHHREGEQRIEMSHNDATAVQLRLDVAEEFTAVIGRLVQQARRSGTSQELRAAT